MKQLRLIDIPFDQIQPGVGARLSAFKKKHNILTHRAKHMDYPWLAVLVQEEDKGKDIGEIMAESCVLYDDMGWAYQGNVHIDFCVFSHLLSVVRVSLPLANFRAQSRDAQNI